MILRFLKNHFKITDGLSPQESSSFDEVDAAIKEAIKTGKPIDLSPQDAFVRKLQHQIIQRHELNSHSYGDEPNRRVRIYPR